MAQDIENKNILLNRFQFAHVQDQNTGIIGLHEGQCRLQLESHEQLIGIFEKIRVFERQWVLVLNPFSEERNDILEGEREVRIGPTTFSLYPGEELLGGVQEEIVLTDRDALLLEALRDAPHPIEEGQILKAGQQLLLKGPRHFIPDKNIKIKETRAVLSLAESEGVYVQNDDTGVVRLVKGATDFFLAHNESLWNKYLTDEEREALGFLEQDDDGESRTLASAPRLRNKNSDAVVIDLEDKEAICLFDGPKTRVEFGPQTVFLDPNERPKVLFISGGVPVKPNVLRIAKLSLGPDFIRDRLPVRTKDNATLELDITFRWRFKVDEEHPEKLFALKDFVGFAAQTLSSEIREEAAKHTFERFHSEAAELVKRTIFGDQEWRLFEENGLEIFGIDVEGITPEDEDIEAKLSDAIKTNVDIFTRRVQEEAQLESERRLIKGRADNEKAKKHLIDLELQNQRRRRLEEAKIEREALEEEARGTAEASRIRAAAEREAEEARLRAVTNVLQGEGGKIFIDWERAKFGQGAAKVFVVPTDSRVHFGVDKVVD